MTDQQIDQEVLELFEESLERVLAEEETKAGLEKLEAAGADIGVEQVRTELLASPEVVLGPAKTMLDGWAGARARLDEAKAERGERIRAAFNWALAGVSLALALVGFQILPSSAKWLAFSVIAVPLAPVYLSLLVDTVTARHRALHEARQRLLTTLDMQTTAAVREAVNRHLTSFSTNFRIFDRRGLRQLANPDREVPTAAAGELTSLVASLDSGSIGLSGPRGCGKTALIRSFTDGRTMPFNKELVGLAVAAPVKYDAREFVLHLFASLCERVLHARPGDLAKAGSRWGRNERKTVVLRLALAACIVGAIGAFLVFEPRPTRETIGLALLFIAYLIVIVGLMVVIDMSGALKIITRQLGGYFGREKVKPEVSIPVEQAAKGYLKQIRFQQSHEVGQSIELTLPFGLGGIGGSSSTTLARTPWTLPDAVEEFRRFAAALSDRYVVIGIDELDKMESDDSAREFLNNVKGVFGVAGCYFLVSVSEDAMSAFERRGLPLRDVFDSSFDEIQRVGFLDLKQSRMVLESRVTGLPVPFQCLCHCLAGGLPRDLIRVTRELVHSYDFEREKRGIAKAGSAPVEITLATLAARLIEAEWRGKLAGATAAGRSAKHSQPWWLTRWLHNQAQGMPRSDSLRDWTLELDADPSVTEPPGEDEDVRKAQRIAVEMMVFNYYAATVLDLFGSERVIELLTPSMQPDVLEPRNGWVEVLAMARQQFSVDPWLSWGLVDEVRGATDLALWDDLRPAPASPPLTTEGATSSTVH